LKLYYEENGYTLEVVKVKMGWAVKAVVNGVARYRGFRYKKDAIVDIETWVNQEQGGFMRDFNHNFDSAEYFTETGK
jgi:hypothetical protein